MLGEGHKLSLSPELIGIPTKCLEVDDLYRACPALKRVEGSLIDDGGCAQTNDIAQVVVVWLRGVHGPFIDD